MGPMQVFLNDNVIGCLDVVRISGEVYTFSLTTILRLNDESSWVLLILCHLPKVFVVCRQHIGCWEKVVIIWQSSFHSHKMSTQTLFICKIIDAREVINSLPWIHLLKKNCDIWGSIKPSYVPIWLIFFRKMPFQECFSWFLNYHIFRLAQDAYPLGFSFTIWIKSIRFGKVTFWFDIIIFVLLGAIGTISPIILSFLPLFKLLFRHSINFVK